MSNIYVIGCTHFGHSGILSFDKDNGEKLRNFPSVEAMDNLMIERWNDTVKDDDIVYHLGDVFFYKKQQKGLETLTKLRGRKRLVLGNHDHKHLFLYMQHKGNPAMFQEVYMDQPLRDFGVILSHRPLHPTELWSYKRERAYEDERDLINIHAHVHARTLTDRSWYFNACAEELNYTPILLSDAVAQAKSYAKPTEV